MSTTQQPETLRDARWYMVNKDGMATLCADREDAEKEAKDANMAWPHTAPHRAVQLVEVASVAASAGSEPVATVFTMEALTPGGGVKYHATIHKALPAGTKLYTHPSSPEGMVGWWISVEERLPEPGVPVLLDIGMEYPIRAMWAAKYTLEVGMDDDSGFGEYDETTDTYYCPEGWYEWNECEDVHWRVDKTPRAWAPLPPTTAADSGKGE